MRLGLVTVVWAWAVVLAAASTSIEQSTTGGDGCRNNDTDFGNADDKQQEQWQ